MGLILWFILAILVGAYANSRGRSGIGFFLLSTILSPVLGIIIAVGVGPDADKLEARAISAGKRRKCPYCAELVRMEARICKHCGKAIARIMPLRKNQ